MPKLIQDAQSSLSLPQILTGVVFEHHFKTLATPMREWQTRHQVPPVLLLTGQVGIGKRSCAYFLARWILCENSGFANPLTPKLDSFGDQLRPCESCPTCLKSKSGHEVNLIEITPDLPEEHQQSSTSLKLASIKIDQLRKLKTTIGFKAHESHAKIILIPNLEQMTTQAANSILKLLEEPPAGWIFIMTTHDPTLLLPTLISRCQILRLKPFKPEEIRAWLATQEVPDDRSTICAQLSQGSLTRALQFLDDTIWNKRKEVFQFLIEPGKWIHSLVDWASQDADHLEILCDLLEQITLDLIYAVQSGKLQNKHWIHSDFQNEMIYYIQRMTQPPRGLSAARNFWMTQAERLAQFRQEISLPLNRKLLVQDLLLPWLGAIAS